MDPRPAERQAGKPDASAAPHRCRGRAARVLSGDAAIATTIPVPALDRVDRLERMWAERPGVLGWLTTTDHKRIGLLYFWTTLVFFGAGGVEALLMRTQLATANNTVLGPNAYDQLFTVHGMT